MPVQYNKSNKKFFLGGELYYEDSIFSRSKLFSDTLYIFDFNNTLIIGNKIYFIGGEDAKGNYIFECDSYNMKEKIWELLPKINYGQEFPSIFCYHKKFLYTFCSLEKEANAYVEIMNINDLNEGWRKMQIEDSVNSFIPTIKSGITQFNDNTLIIWGGYLI